MADEKTNGQLPDSEDAQTEQQTDASMTDDLTTDDQAPEESSDKPQYRRGIKSFVIRAGRLTKGQQGGLERQ